MKDKGRLKKIAAKSAKISFPQGKIKEDNVVSVVKNLKTLPRSQAIYAISKFIKGLKNKSREGNAVIESATPLSSKQINSIMSKLNNNFSVTGVENKINPELLGGIRVRIGDTVLDYSLKNKISQVGEVIAS